MKNIFNSISTYHSKKKKKKEKKTYVNKHKKQMYKCVARKINLYFPDVMKNGQTFSSKVCHFQYDHRFLFRREMGNIRRCNEIRLQKHIQFGLTG